MTNQPLWEQLRDQAMQSLMNNKPAPPPSAAQAVYNAVLEICPAPADEIAAAALRALAVRTHGADVIRQDILDIAAELEAMP